MVYYFPLVAYLSVYLVTCFVAAVPFYFRYESFLVLLDYFSGVTVPNSFSTRQNVVILLLFLVGPVVFSAAYFWVVSGKSEVRSEVCCSPCEKVPLVYPFFAFFLTAFIAMSGLSGAGVFSSIAAWVDYGQWVRARMQVFSNLGYFEFVNIYIVLPMAAAWVLLNSSGGRSWVRILSWIPVLVTFCLTFFLFQKKAIVVALFLIFGARYIHGVFSGKSARNSGFSLALCVAVVFVSYVLLLVIPVYSETTTTADVVLVQKEYNAAPAAARVPDSTPPSAVPENVPANVPNVDAKQEIAVRKAAAIRSVLGSARSMHVLFYSLLAPITRTSIPAVYYVVVFPEHHEYFGLDLGQDILGRGNMPDDNHVVWDYIYPDTPGGSVAAPFQFVLYSQVGVFGALLLCALMGGLVGFAWRSVVTSGGDPVWRSLTGVLVLLFAIYLAIDSVRGSFVSSYGVVWGLIFVVVAYAAVRLCRRSRAMLSLPVGRP